MESTTASESAKSQDTCEEEIKLHPIENVSYSRVSYLKLWAIRETFFVSAFDISKPGASKKMEARIRAKWDQYRTTLRGNPEECLAGFKLSKNLIHKVRPSFHLRNRACIKVDRST